MKSIKDRIEMLSSLNMIDEKGRLDLLKIIDIIESKFQIKISEERGGILITHVAVLFQRNMNGECINPLSSEVSNQLKSNTHYVLAQETVDLIATNIYNSIPDIEKDYLILHLCTLMNSYVNTS